MEVLIALIAFFTIFILPVHLLIQHYRRDWIGMWRGKKIQITEDIKGFRKRTKLFIDDEELTFDKIGIVLRRSTTL